MFANLLTNAVKAAGEGGVIAARATPGNGDLQVTVENTGDRVNPDDGERWFQPFRSSTVETDPVLGRGLGLGLAIVRNILAEYGAGIRFSKARPPFATALTITFPTDR